MKTPIEQPGIKPAIEQEGKKPLIRQSGRAAISAISARLSGWRAHFAHLILIPDLSGEDGRELRLEVYSDGALTPGYMLMCGLSAGIAALGLLQSSTAVVIGAMLVSPLMTPIVALGFAFASFDGRRIREAARVVIVGAVIGILVAMLLTWLSPIRNATPEIIARTEPTLLDLGIALLSGLAGGYAIVQQKGATAIGVAIATALMPPLAVVGYSLGVGQFDFALGGLLLFLTNLAAIAFAIGLIARLSGAARPFHKAELTPRYIAIAALAFLALATPLALTLVRVTHEASARSAARQTLTEELGIGQANIAQLDVKWPLGGDPSVDAVVIAPEFRTDAQSIVLKRLTAMLGAKPALNLQQIVAADFESQTRAMVDAAMERTASGISKDVPPFADIRAALGIPVQSVWINRAERIVNIVPVAATQWTLSDYRDDEAIVERAAGGWRIRIVPPVQEQLKVATEGDNAEAQTRLAVWAIQRWGLREVRIEMPSGKRKETEVQSSIDALIARFSKANITATGKITKDDGGDATIFLFGESPSQRRARLETEG